LTNKILNSSFFFSQDDEKSLRFLPFQLKENMHLPPICRRINFEEENHKIKEALDQYLSNQVGYCLLKFSPLNHLFAFNSRMEKAI
jgi:hypothetical protein